MASTVADIMERHAQSIHLEAGVEDVVARFKDQDISALPVVNEGERCVGPVTRADVLAALHVLEV